MSRTPSRVALPLFVAVLLAVGSATAADPPAKPLTKEQIAELVKGLGSDSFEEREKASQALWKAGSVAEPALRRVLKDGDAEAVRRAREILDKYEWGVYPDTPEAVVNLIEEYRSGTPESRAAVVPKLLEQGGPGFTALMKIAAAEKAPEAKAAIWQLLAADMPRLAAALLADGQGDRLEEFLEQALGGDGEQPPANYAAYLMVRGKLDDKLRDLQKKSGAAPDKKAALTLAYLCRAKGDLAGARRYAEKAAHPELLRTVLVEQEDWKALLKQLDEAGVDKGPAPEALQEAVRGLRLACLRLLGAREDFAAELRKPGADVGVAALLLNGRVEDAMTVLTKNNRHTAAAELLGARLRFREALDMAERAGGQDDALTAGVFTAGLLARLGDRKKAGATFDKLAESAKPETALAVIQGAIMAEANAGLTDAAFQRAAGALAKLGENDDPALILTMLFQPAEAEVGTVAWWKFLRGKFPKDDAGATLKRMRDLFARKTPPRDVADLLKEMTDGAAKLPAEEHEVSLRCAVETCRALSRDDLLEGYLEKWAAVAKDGSAWLRLGDFASERKRWKDAAERYKRAWEKDRAAALPLYLHGHALAQAGQEKDGRRWMDAAEALPLGIEERREALASGLAERGLDEAAGREWERLGRLALLTSGYDAVIDRALADKANAAKDYSRAAAYYRREALHNLSSPGFEDVEGNLWLVAAEHRARACALAKAGRLEEMRKEVQVALDASPGDVELVIDAVPELMKRGQKKEADELFGRVYAVHDALCKEYPKSAWCHNNTAWLLVRCRRDLDAALAHARQGVELEPDNAGHLDTLAEVHFQRGDKDRAIELMKKCLVMVPKYSYFQKQLRRMQAGDRDADLPSEPATGTSLRSLVVPQ